MAVQSTKQRVAVCQVFLRVPPTRPIFVPLREEMALIARAFHRTMACMDQLVFAFSPTRRYTFESLVVHEGIEQALSTIRSVYGSHKPPLPSLFLYGLPGTGKTHLLHALETFLDDIFHEEALRVKWIDADDGTSALAELGNLLSDESAFSRLAAVAVDNVHEVHGQAAVHLWNLSNKLTRSGAALLMASRKPAGETFPADPHLTSRITSGLVLCLDPPDDAVRVLIMDKMARDRSIRISPDVSRYLITRKSRNISDLNRIMDILDRASLQFKRRITVPFIKSLEKAGEL